MLKLEVSWILRKCLHSLGQSLTLVEYVAKYASKEAADEAGEDTESEDEMSSVGSYESGGEEPAGEMDDVWLSFFLFIIQPILTSGFGQAWTQVYCIIFPILIFSSTGTGLAGVIMVELRISFLEAIMGRSWRWESYSCHSRLVNSFKNDYLQCTGYSALGCQKLYPFIVVWPASLFLSESASFFYLLPVCEHEAYFFLYCFSSFNCSVCSSSSMVSFFFSLLQSSTLVEYH